MPETAPTEPTQLPPAIERTTEADGESTVTFEAIDRRET